MKRWLARLRGGGCGASKPSDSPAQGAPPRAQAQAKKLNLKYVKLDLPEGAPDSFEMTTPMLAMAFPLFVSNKRIFKATKKSSRTPR